MVAAFLSSHQRRAARYWRANPRYSCAAGFYRNYWMFRKNYKINGVSFWSHLIVYSTPTSIGIRGKVGLHTGAKKSNQPKRSPFCLSVVRIIWQKMIVIHDATFFPSSRNCPREPMLFVVYCCPFDDLSCIHFSIIIRGHLAGQSTTTMASTRTHSMHFPEGPESIFKLLISLASTPLLAVVSRRGAAAEKAVFDAAQLSSLSLCIKEMH